jgi:hypothetical protein
METMGQKAKRRSVCDNKVERKRELDRLAQRATRERTKNRIAFLEQKLASLESHDQSSEILNLTKIIEGLREDNARLQSALMKMKLTINDALGDIVENAVRKGSSTDGPASVRSCGCPGESECRCGGPVAVQDRMSTAASSTPRQDSVHSLESEPVIDVPHQPMQPTMPENVPVAPEAQSGIAGLENFFGMDNAFSPSVMNQMSNWNFPQWQQTTPSPFDFQMSDPDAALTLAKDIDKWQVSNGAFINCMDSIKHKMATNQTLDLHVPFKAAIWGWDSIGPEVNHPVWAALRRVDQKVFGTWSNIAQRIALMYICQTLLQYRENPTKQNLDRVPAWFRPRPAQEKIQHPAVIDFLVWPGLRDRLVFEHQKYTKTGDLSAAFVENFHFDWPYTEREIFTYDENMNAFEVSNVFLQYVYDFKKWTMKPNFFKRFPEMQHDIPEFGSSTPASNIWVA